MTDIKQSIIEALKAHERGLSTAALAETLGVQPWQVGTAIKSIRDKVALLRMSNRSVWVLPDQIAQLAEEKAARTRAARHERQRQYQLTRAPRGRPRNVPQYEPFAWPWPRVPSVWELARVVAS